MTPRRMTLGRASRGFSLVELMISLVIGMVVVGAVFAAYLGSGFSSRHSQAMAQMTEDGSVALKLLRSHLATAGYSRAVGLGSGGELLRAYTGAGLRGCRGTFTHLGVDIGALSCPGTAASTDPDSVAVAYQVDGRNGVLSSDDKPLDCVGNGIDETSPGLALSYSRFYLDTPTGASQTALYCRGSGGDTPQALVENIIDLRLSYGVGTTPDPNLNRRVAYYADAGSLSADDFNRVMAVKVCVIVASVAEVMDEVTAYRPCDPFGSVVTPADRRMYRAFTSTIVMHNRAGVLHGPSGS